MYQSPPPTAGLARSYPFDVEARLLPSRGQALAAALLASFALLLLMLVATRLDIDWRSTGAITYYGVIAAEVVIRLGFGRSPRRWRRALAHFCEYALQFMLIGLLGALASYPVSAASRGFYDPALEEIDRLLRFDWLAWYALVAAHPALQLLGRIAYESIYYTPALILGFFAWTGRRREAQTMLSAFWTAAVITLAMFWFMPAVGPFAYLWHGPAPYLPESELWQPELIPALRHHAIHVIDPGQLKGLVSAPSFHTAAAVLYIVAAWPHRALRWPVLAINAAMLLSTPVEGTHYLADMIAGAAVALCSLRLIGWLERLPFPRHALPADLAALLRRA